MADTLGCGIPAILIQRGDAPEDVMELARAVEVVEYSDNYEEVFPVRFPDSQRDYYMKEIDLRNAMFAYR